MTETQNNGLCGFWLRLHGDSLVPEAVDNVLGVSATRSWKKGDLRLSKGGQIKCKSGLWSMEAQSDSRNINDHIADLLLKLDVSRNIYDLIPEVEFAEFSIFISTKSDEAGSGGIEFDIEPKQWNAIGILGARVSFDFSVTSPDE